jgi:hypothetical protein
VEEVEKAFAQIVIHPKQLEILQKKYQKPVWLNGPPGVGKSIVLYFKGDDHLRKSPENHVHIVSSCHGSLAASHILYKQLEEKKKNRVHFHHYQFHYERGKKSAKEGQKQREKSPEEEAGHKGETWAKELVDKKEKSHGEVLVILDDACR